jgi:hypothetical protein
LGDNGGFDQAGFGGDFSNFNEGYFDSGQSFGRKFNVYSYGGAQRSQIRTKTQANDVVVAIVVVVEGVSMVVAQVAEHCRLFYLKRICGHRRRTTPVVGDTTSAADGSGSRSYATFYQCTGAAAGVAGYPAAESSSSGNDW